MNTMSPTISLSGEISFQPTNTIHHREAPQANSFASPIKTSTGFISLFALSFGQVTGLFPWVISLFLFVWWFARAFFFFFSLSLSRNFDQPHNATEPSRNPSLPPKQNQKVFLSFILPFVCSVFSNRTRITRTTRESFLFIIHHGTFLQDNFLLFFFLVVLLVLIVVFAVALRHRKLELELLVAPNVAVAHEEQRQRVVARLVWRHKVELHLRLVLQRHPLHAQQAVALCVPNHEPPPFAFGLRVPGGVHLPHRRRRR
mmetsp:Transcript_65190/g.112092  ORF Transcript_65190/g.112092 Transcript_65190/m.112092 type:complete len:258 (+) Transcript_65190:159-932(+)